MSETKARDPTGEPQDRRKLVAVMYADMVGYSRLIGLDDAGTLQRLRSLRSNLIDPAIDEHGGKIVQTGGDSLLIVFDSIDGAVRCAVKVQQQIPIHDGEQPPDRAIRFRIGVNIGDAIADGTDLHGDAVNVAARLQAECPPGGICVSRSVRDHVRGRLDLTFEELGSLNLKNIAYPVEAFVVRSDAVVPMATPFMSLMQGSTEALPLPDRPSIAVLPFANLSADPEQDYFSDGVADDVITELSRCHWLFVIARNSSFTYRGSADVRQVARELGVRYVVTGSVRRVAPRLRITAQLTDAIGGNQIWAERYDRDLADVFAVQDEIAEAVATAIRPAVGDAEQRRILRKQPNNLSAWETYQRGLCHLSVGTAAENEQARLLFRRSAEIDPGFALAYVGLALTLLRDAVSYGIRPVTEAGTLAEVEARNAVGLDPTDSEAHAALAAAVSCLGNMPAALDYAERALALNRNSVSAHFVKGGLLIYSGRGEGRDDSLMSLRLSPRDPVSPMAACGIVASYYLERDYSATVEAARRYLAEYPNYALIRRFLVAALGQVGRQDEGAAALREFVAVAPNVFDLTVRNRLPYVRPEDHEHLLDGLRKAGWQG